MTNKKAPSHDTIEQMNIFKTSIPVKSLSGKGTRRKKLSQPFIEFRVWLPMPQAKAFQMIKQCLLSQLKEGRAPHE